MGYKKRRAHGEGTMYEDARSGLWHGQITLPDGNQQSLYASSQGKRLDKMNKAKENVGKGLPAVPPKQTLCQFLTGSSTALSSPKERDQLSGWLGEVARTGTRAGVFVLHEEICRLHIVPALGKKRLGSLTPLDCQWLYRRKLDAGLSPGAVKHIHGVLQNALATPWPGV